MTQTNVLYIVFSLAVLAGAPVAGYADGDAAPTCNPEESKIEAKDKCYKDLFDKCKAGGKAAGDYACEHGPTALKDKEDTKGNSANLGSTFGTSSTMYTSAVKTCENMKAKCESICSKAKTGSDKTVKECQDDFEKVQDTFKTAGSSYGTQSAALNSRAENVSSGDSKDEKTNGTSTTAGDKSATKEADKGGGMNMGSMAGMAGMAAMAGMAIAKKMGEDEDKEAAAAASMSALQPNGTVLCDKADSGLYVACNSYLETACTQSIQNGTFSASPTCTNFATRYCTGGDGSLEAASATTTTPGGTAAGGTATASTTPTLGVQGGGSNTRFCSSAIAYNYCAGGAYPTCSKCLELQNLTSLACQSNPASCMAQSSDAATSATAGSCPGYPQTVAATAATAAPNVIPGTPTSATSALTALTLPNVSTGMQAASLQSVSKSSIIGRSTASSVGPASDIGGEYGPSLSNMTTQAIGKRCQVDHLNNCP